MYMWCKVFRGTKCLRLAIMLLFYLFLKRCGRYGISIIQSWDCSTVRSSWDSSFRNFASEEEEDVREQHFFTLEIKEVIRRIQNWEKWSVKSEILLPLAMLSSRLLANMLSICEYELWCTLVGLSIVGVSLKLCTGDKIKLCAYLQSWKRRT